MTNIYEQFEKHFSHASCYVILKGGDIKGKIAFKYPKDGAGRLTAYVHEYGFEMIKGIASGYGYDKRSAAVRNAVSKDNQDSPIYNLLKSREVDSKGFDGVLRDAGYQTQGVM